MWTVYLCGDGSAKNWPTSGWNLSPISSILEWFNLAWVQMPFFLFVDPLDQRTRVMSCTQFVSQVLPSSGEAACSQWPDVGVMLDQMKRARTRFPLTVSSP